MKQKIWIILGVLLLAVCLLLVLTLKNSPKEKENAPAYTGAPVVASLIPQSDARADATDPAAPEDVTAEAVTKEADNTEAVNTEPINTEAENTDAANTDAAATEATAALIEDGGDVEIIIPDDQGSGGF